MGEENTAAINVDAHSYLTSILRERDYLQLRLQAAEAKLATANAKIAEFECGKPKE